MFRQPHELRRLVGDDAHRAALDPAEAGEDVRREQRLRLEELGVVQDVFDHAVHVVRLVGAVRDQRVQLAVLVRQLQVRVLGERGGLAEVVRRQVGEKGLDVLDRVLLVARHVVRDTGGAVVGAGTAELLEADVLAGDGLDDVGSGDEHVRRLVDHDGEVGDGGGVDRAARARADDQADLRDHTGGVGVPAEDLPVHPEGHDALLDAGAAGVVDADDRTAGLQGEVHDLDDLLAEDLAECPAEDGEVLGEDGHGAAVDGAVTGHDSVAVGAVGLQAEVGRAVLGELVELDEGAFVQEQFDALTRRQLALGVLLLDRASRTGVLGLLDAALEISEFSRSRMDVDTTCVGDGGGIACGAGHGHVGLFRLGHRDAAPCLLKGATGGLRCGLGGAARGAACGYGSGAVIACY